MSYPVVSGIPILVEKPAGYIASELASLTRARDRLRQRNAQLERIGSDADLPQASVDRHRSVITAEISQIEMFLALLEPATDALAVSRCEEKEARSAPRSGWAFDTLLPYLIRDWSGTTELDTAETLIGMVLQKFFPEPGSKSVGVAGCGAGGLLVGIAPAFGRVVGFDLTLPILGAARHLLDGKDLDVPLPYEIHERGHIVLSGHHATATDPLLVIAAMDIFDTAFADGALDCVITSFLIDLIPNPQKLAEEIHRILCVGGIWINYGPSGPLNALWRFDNVETAAFFGTVGFTTIHSDMHRTTYLDLSRDCPSWSSRNHVCYLTAARKTGPRREKREASAPAPDPAQILQIIPQHFSGATLIQRQSLEPKRARTILLRFERLPGQTESMEISADDVRILALVNGEQTVQEIARRLNHRAPVLPEEETIRAFTRYFQLGLLRWHD